ncbi:MAG TPA: sterol-binding protein [Burkholderiales bacterium]|nr:sterol-binding protein [Burkholderiales bacterium]
MLTAAPPIAILNHLLHGQPWLRERLIAFAGRHALLEAPPLTLAMQIASDGRLSEADRSAPPDATIRLSAFTAFRLLRGDERARADVRVDGDPAFAAALSGVLRELRWDVEEDLSRLVGDIAARRIVGTAERLHDWQRQARDHFATNVSEYLTEERPMLARKADVARWVEDVDRLRNDVERLEKRVERLTGTASR